MSWSLALASLDKALLYTFGLVAAGLSPALIPQDGSSSQPIDGIPLRTPEAEDYVIGSAKAPTIIHLQVMTETMARIPVRGDAITIGNATYFIRDIQVNPDPADSSAVLRLVKQE